MNSRDKGVKYEQKLARELRENGWSECVTSRSESKNTDDLGVDFVNTGSFSIQAKATERTPPYTDMLKDMWKAFKTTIPMIFHKRNNRPETVTLLKDDAYKLMKVYQYYRDMKKDKGLDRILEDIENVIAPV